MASKPGPVNLQNQPASSNIFQLPSLSGMIFSVVNNAGWYDAIYFTQSPTSTTPIDLSNMDFHAELRINPGDARNALNISSLANPPQFVNGGANGILFFSVDISLMQKLSVGPYSMDILAIDHATGMVKNLCDAGPIVVNVLQGVTR